MNEQHSDLLDRARGLAAARLLIEREIDVFIRDATDAGLNMTALARVLGLHRATLYRRLERGAETMWQGDILRP